MKTGLFNSYTILASVIFLICGFLVLAMFSDFTSKVEAAGVSVTVSTPAGGEFAATTTTDVTFGYVTSATEYGIGDTINIVISPALAGSLTNCASATTDADGDATPDGSFGSFTTTGAVYTFSAATTDAASTGVDLCLRFANTTTAGVYSISVTDDNDGDFGAVLVYVGDDNDVNVQATVQPTLSLNIRNLADSADTNTCNLGTVTTTTAPNLDLTDDGAGECGYAIAVGTNAANGFQVQIDANQTLQNGAAYTIADVTNAGSFSAGTEAYGLANVTSAETGHDGAGNFDQTITEDGNFATNATPIPNSPTNFVSYNDSILYTAGTNALDTTRVMHGLAISSATQTGVYTQTVTYTVTATF